MRRDAMHITIKKTVLTCALMLSSLGACTAPVEEESASSSAALEPTEVGQPNITFAGDRVFGDVSIVHHTNQRVYAWLQWDTEFVEATRILPPAGTYDGSTVVHTFSFDVSAYQNEQPHNAQVYITDVGYDPALDFEALYSGASTTPTTPPANNAPSCSQYKSCKTCAAVVGCGWCGGGYTTPNDIVGCVPAITVNVDGVPKSNSPIAPNSCRTPHRWASATHTCF
jgi:hypothetical protein